MKDVLVQYLTNRIPKDFVKHLPEALEAAYFQAHQDSMQKCGEPERVRVRGQLRHYYQNGAIREVAGKHNIASFSPHTDPKGERYSVVAMNDVVMGRTAVRFANKLPALARHRKTIAAVNSRLEPTNYDLFSTESPKMTEGVGVLIVTVHPSLGADQSVPSHFIVGVPYSNLRGWHLFEPLTSFLAAYEPAVSMKATDLAFPTLKIQLREAEGK